MPHWHATHGSVTSLFTRQIRVRAVHSKDTFSLERLAWGIYDNVLGPRKIIDMLTGFETYGQVL